MKYIQFDQTGDASVLQVHDADEPTATGTQVVIRVAYAALNNFDVMARQTGYRIALPYRPGLEVSGTVTAIGEMVESIAVGDTVAAYTGGGGYAEYVQVDESLVFVLKTPQGVIDLQSGAALPMVIPTAIGLLQQAARIKSGDTVLVHGAAGGVGLAVGQLAKLYGAATVVGTVSTADKIPIAEQKGGYDHVYMRSEYEQHVHTLLEGRGMDIVLDPSGNPLSPVLAPFGRVVVYGNAGNKLATSLTAAQLLATNSGVLGYSITNLIASRPDVYRTTVLQARDLLAREQIAIDISAVFDLADAAQAHQLLESGQTSGKLLLRVGPVSHD